MYLAEAGKLPAMRSVPRLRRRRGSGGKRGAAAIAALLAQRGVKLDYVIDEGLLILQGIVPGLPKAAATVGVAEKGYATFRLEVSAPPGHSMRCSGRRPRRR